MQSPILYEALVRFPLAQTGGRLTFLDRLCQENGWPHHFGERAIAEYKKFVYLAAVSPVPVTPSDAVDQVWHLHLVYTRSYWERLVPLLSKPLHHGPTEGGAAEDTKFEDWYERTKDFYTQEFLGAPPEDLWAASASRFDPRQRFRRLDTKDYWMVRRFSLGGTRALAPMLAIWALPLLAAEGKGKGLGAGGLALGVLLILGGIAWLMARMSGPKRKKAEGSDVGGWESSSCGSDSSCGDRGDAGCGDGGGDGGGSGCGGGGCGS